MKTLDSHAHDIAQLLPESNREECQALIARKLKEITVPPDRVGQPILAIDLSSLIVVEKARWPFFYFKSDKLSVHYEVEQMLLLMSDRYNIALLADEKLRAQDYKRASEELVPGIAKYIVPCRNADEFELFMVTFLPMLVFSNLWQEYGCSPMGAFAYENREVLMRQIQGWTGNQG